MPTRCASSVDFLDAVPDRARADAELVKLALAPVR